VLGDEGNNGDDLYSSGRSSGGWVAERPDGGRWHSSRRDWHAAVEPSSMRASVESRWEPQFEQLKGCRESPSAVQNCHSCPNPHSRVIWAASLGDWNRWFRLQDTGSQWGRPCSDAHHRMTAMAAGPKRRRARVESAGRVSRATQGPLGGMLFVRDGGDPRLEWARVGTSGHAGRGCVAAWHTAKVAVAKPQPSSSFEACPLALPQSSPCCQLRASSQCACPSWRWEMAFPKRRTWGGRWGSPMARLVVCAGGWGGLASALHCPWGVRVGGRSCESVRSPAWATASSLSCWRSPACLRFLSSVVRPGWQDGRLEIYGTHASESWSTTHHSSAPRIPPSAAQSRPIPHRLTIYNPPWPSDPVPPRPRRHCCCYITPQPAHRPTSDDDRLLPSSD